MSDSLVSRVDALCAAVGAELSGDQAARLQLTRERLRGPLRIAIAGRVKAGKSTLLNALIGERLAPTDAGECTRVVTWYRQSPTYEVRARTKDGRLVDLPFRKGERSLEYAPPAGQQAVTFEIGWPSRSLANATYIDTPGPGSLTPAAGLASRELLGVEGTVASQADAVVYLMRHAHAEDIEFLEGFRDSGLPLGSPINTVAVLSRADEVGACRLDALDSARTVAARCLQDERLGGLAGAMIPVAGLLAETAATLQEDEFAWIRELARSGEAATSLLLSVDRFRGTEGHPLAAEVRDLLLERFGIFGLRFSVAALQRGDVNSSAALSGFLLGASGIGELRNLIQERFTSRSQTLVARSGIQELQAIADEFSAAGSTTAASRISGAFEELLASAHEFAELDTLHNIAVGVARVDETERAEVEQLFHPGDVHTRLGLDAAVPADGVRQELIARISRWRTRAAGPLTDRATARGCETVARSLEGLYAGLGTPGG